MRRMGLVDRRRFIVGLAVAIAVVSVAFNLLSSGKFITEPASLAITSLVGPLGIIALGVTVLMISGEFDLSVTATFVTAPVVMSLSMEALGFSPTLALLLGVFCTFLVGMANGLVVVITGIPSFIVTLATLFVVQMFLRIALPQFSVDWNTESQLKNMFAGRSELVPFAKSFLWLIAIGIVLWIILNRSRVGNWVFATGSRGGRAAKAMGVPTWGTKVGCFALCASLAGFAGCVQFADYGLVSLTSGTGINLMAIAATVIGGTSLFGGRGTVIGTMLGATLLIMFNIGPILSGIEGNWYLGLVGLLILSASIVNARSQSRTTRTKKVVFPIRLPWVSADSR